MRTSVIIPNYNYADYIVTAIDSVLMQSEKVDEIIVVDDGSTDNSRTVISGYGDKVIQVFQNNAGQAAAISAGFERATGDIVLLLDSDDFFFTDKVKIVKRLYADNLSVGWVFHDLSEIEGKNKPAGTVVQFDASQVLKIDERKGIRDGKVVYDAPATSGMTFRKSFIDSLFPLPTAQSIYISDHYIKFYCLAMAEGLHSSQHLGGQLIHGSNLYTGHKNLTTRGKIFVNTAYALKQKCPDAASFCNSIMAEGRACLSAVGGSLEMEGLIQKYNADLSPLELLLIEGKSFIKSRRYRKETGAS